MIYQVCAKFPSAKFLMWAKCLCLVSTISYCLYPIVSISPPTSPISTLYLMNAPVILDAIQIQSIRRFDFSLLLEEGVKYHPTL